MSHLRSLSSGLLLLLTVLSVPSCKLFKKDAGPSAYQYYIFPSRGGRNADSRMADYLKKHLANRTDQIILDRSGLPVEIYVGNDFGGDYAVQYLPDGGYALYANSERTMTWLCYQFIKHVGEKDSKIRVEDLPPSVFPVKDTVARFPFEYRDIYMPTNQNPDMTYLLALDNLEEDWGIWGHNLSRVLGSNGETYFGYQNQEQELFARTNGLVHKNQFCFSSDRLLELTEKYILAQYSDGRERPLRFTIAPNDNDYVCTCRRCEIAGNTLTNATPAVVNFVEKLAARFPNHTFFITGYSTTQALPDHALPANVGVFLSAIDYPRVSDDQGSPAQDAFFAKLEAWKKVTDNIYIWDYICNFDDYLSPYPIFYAMQKRFQAYMEHGVKGIFLNGSGYYYSTLQEMYTIVLADLLADPYADVERLVRQYFADTMPHIGDFFASVILSMEQHTRRAGTELPLYGGIDEAMHTYLFEKEFREFYSVFLRAKDMEMTHKERVVYEKTRQFVSYSYLEMCRLHGLNPGGFAELVGSEWVVKPDVWAAVEDLKIFTPEDDLEYLTSSEETSFDHMDRVNEVGVYIADYENELEIWLGSQIWKGDYLLRVPLKVHSLAGTETETRLTDGVAGISQNYHWGWQVYPQEDLVIDIPADAVDSKSGEITMSFLNSERHRMSPPAEVQIWTDGHMAALLKREGLSDYYDEGEKVGFRGAVSFGHPSKVEMRFKRSHTRNLAIDEICFK